MGSGGREFLPDDQIDDDTDKFLSGKEKGVPRCTATEQDHDHAVLSGGALLVWQSWR